MKPLVIIESPFAGDVEANIRYARRAMHDSLMRGEAPFASHLLYTQDGVLDDLDPHERELGITAGHEFMRVVDLVVVYTDRGISNGMNMGIDRAARHGVPVEYRTIGG